MTKRYEPLEPDSVFWPKVGKDEGASLEGVFEDTEPGKYNEHVLLIRTADGLRKVPASARIAAVLPKMKLGARYRFTYHGMVSIKGGQAVKDITVERVRDDTPDAVETELPQKPDDDPF
jgi:hypothetical protein